MTKKLGETLCFGKILMHWMAIKSGWCVVVCGKKTVWMWQGLAGEAIVAIAGHGFKSISFESLKECLILADFFYTSGVPNGMVVCVPETPLKNHALPYIACIFLKSFESSVCKPVCCSYVYKPIR